MNASDHLARLFDVAEAQAGYFTTAQAAAASVDRRRLAYHATAGRLQRIRHGIYRLVQFPHSRYEDLFIAARAFLDPVLGSTTQGVWHPTQHIWL